MLAMYIFSEELNCRVSQLEFAERRLTADLEYSRKELQHYKDVNKDLEGNLEQMSDRLGLYIETEAEVKVSMGVGYYF